MYVTQGGAAMQRFLIFKKVYCYILLNILLKNETFPNLLYEVCIAQTSVQLITENSTTALFKLS